MWNHGMKKYIQRRSSQLRMQLNTVAKRRHVTIQASIIYLQGHAELEFRTLKK